jgi:hypothetical protein
MPLPSGPVILSPGEVANLNEKLSKMRHDINNNLALVVAAVELIHCKPQMTEQMLSTLSAQPGKIAECIRTFSNEFETALGMKKE